MNKPVEPNTLPSEMNTLTDRSNAEPISRNASGNKKITLHIMNSGLGTPNQLSHVESSPSTMKALHEGYGDFTPNQEI